MGSYLAHSYVSWEKGGVEDMNELIIRYIPKNIGILTVMIEQIQTKLNNKHSKKKNGFTNPKETISQTILR